MKMFISYSHQDYNPTEELVKLLVDAKHEPFYDLNLLPGRDWKEELIRQIENAEVFIFVLSKNWLQSDWCKWEFFESVRLDKPIIPVLIEHIDKIPEPFSKLQFTDCKGGFTGECMTKLLTALVDQEKRLSFDDIAGSQPDPQHSPVQKHLSGDKSLTIVGLILAFLSVIIGLIALLPEDSRNEILYIARMIGPSPTAPPCTPSPMGGDFRLVVAGLPIQQSGEWRETTTSDSFNAILASQITDLIEGADVRSIGDCGVDYIPVEKEEEQIKKAEAMADLFQAHLVIYGSLVEKENDFVEFQPQFYISPNWVKLQPELVEADTLGTPLSVPKNPVGEASSEISNRVEILEAFLIGLQHFLTGDYQEAETQFSQIAEKYNTEDLEVIWVMAGNAAGRQNDCRTALSYYTRSLDTRPEYARGLLGRGNAFFNCAGELYRNTITETLPPLDETFALPADTRCLDDAAMDSIEALLAMAEICYQEAELSSDFSPLSDMDTKIPYFKGLLYSWQADRDYRSNWDQVISEMTIVIDIYDQADDQNRARIAVIASRAYETLGKAIVNQSCTESEMIQEAISHYEMASIIIARYPDPGVVNSRQTFEEQQIEKLNTDPCSLLN